MILDKISEAVINMDSDIKSSPDIIEGRREKLTKLVERSYEYGQRHDRSAKEDLIRSILSGGYD